ncbi:glycosyltransferase [Candidatus Roizmanbacteria bacterium]|nr:glycosyltransferase [Candidatus Roizmanbacteria bacterium]
MKHYPTLTIAVPAYNEENTIEHLLRALIMQENGVYKLNEIIVISDGSSDKTAALVKKLQLEYPIIQLRDDKQRMGKIARLNQFFSDTTSDFLCIIDADMILTDTRYLKKIMAKVTKDPKAQMISLHQEPLRPTHFVGKLFYATFVMWDFVRLSIPNYDHVQNYYCGATVYRKSFFSNLCIPKDVFEERIYLYLMAQKLNGFRFYRTPLIHYWPITSFSDYFKLADRAFGSNQKKLEKLFGKEVNTIHIIPWKYKCIGIVKSFYHQPLYTPIALVFGYTLSILAAYKPKQKTALWDISRSTKVALSPIPDKHTVIISCYDDLKNPSYAGGGAFCIFELAKRLTKKFRVIVITGTYKNAQNETIEGIEYLRIGSSVFGHRIGQLVYQFALLPIAARFRYKLWIESSTPPFTFSLLPLVIKKPLLIWIHMFCGKEMKRKYNLPFEKVEHFLANNYSHAVVLSEYMKHQLRTVNNHCSISIIPNGVSKDMIVSIGNTSSAYMLFIGRIEISQKGIDLLLEAFDTIPSTNKPKLLIAGDGDIKEVNKLKSLIHSSASFLSISYVGKVSGLAKQRLFKNASAVLVPSRFDTYPLTILEAFSYGKPVVLFSIPELSWVPNNASIQIPPYSLTEFGKAMKRIHTDKQLQMQLGSQGLSFVKRNTLEIISKKFEELSFQLI